MLRLSPTLKRALALFLGAFALYALTAQRGLGWGDSGEFQHRILVMGAEGLLKGCDSFATAHPLYVALGKIFSSTPFQVTLLSAFFGALAVVLVYLLVRNVGLAVLFGLAHGVWWLSTVAEVYTMSLCFFAAELLALRRFRETGGTGALIALAALNGLHLEVHNFALLAIPVYAWVVLWGRGVANVDGSFSDAVRTPRPQVRTVPPWGRGVSPHRLGLAALIWILCASFWLWSFFTLGPAQVLWGRYCAQVLTLKPIIPLAVPFNWFLGGISLVVPALLAVAWWRGRETRDGEGVRRETRDTSRKAKTSIVDLLSRPTFSLFLIHFLFWATYFIVSQFTFVLPSVLLAYLLVREVRLSRGLFWTLLAVQLALPLAAWGLFSAIEFPADYRAWHPGRDDASYFALPWHFTDDSASRAAALRRTPWTGYP